MSFAVMPLADYKNTCDKVREKTGTEDAIKSGELAGEVEKVFEAGKDKGLRMVMNSIQNNGIRKDCIALFKHWYNPEETFYPVHNIKPVGSVNQMFGEFNRFEEENGKMVDKINSGRTNTTFNLVERLKECNVEIDFSEATAYNYAFINCRTTHFPLIDARSMTSCPGTFQYSHVQYVEKIILPEEGKGITGLFSYWYAVIEIRFEGKILGGVDAHHSYQMSADSAKSIISCLENYAGTDKELTYSFILHSNVWTRLNESGAPPSENTWEEYVNTLGYNVAST